MENKYCCSKCVSECINKKHFSKMIFDFKCKCELSLKKKRGRKKGYEKNIVIIPVEKTLKRKLTQRTYVKNKLKMDINFRVTNNLRSRVNQALRGKCKSSGTMSLIGIDINGFKKHISSKFKPGMSFDNYGEWEIDHIKPCSWFDLTDPNQQKQCFHYSNTQPLWRSENRSKNNKHCN